MFSSNSDEWTTPSWIYEELDNEFNFDLDPCCTEETHKCKNYYTKMEDGLSKNWGGSRVFCNPPYSEVGKWVEKAFYETKKENTLVVMLLPSRTDTKYFHDFIYQRSEIRFVRGRLKFGDSKNSAPFPSMIVVFRGAKV